jgi:hypothetical protein
VEARLQRHRPLTPRRPERCEAPHTRLAGRASRRPAVVSSAQVPRAHLPVPRSSALPAREAFRRRQSSHLLSADRRHGGPGGAQLFTDGKWSSRPRPHLAGVATHVEPGLCRSHNPRWSRLSDGRLPLPQELHKLETAAGPLLVRTTTTRLVVGRETAESPGPCESRCSSKSVSRCSSGASRGKASAAVERSSACPHRADDREQADAHIARRGRSMGATVRGCHAAPMQSRKQASAGPTRDAWFATDPIASADPR